MSEFTCETCKQTFKKINNENWNNYKATEEFLRLMPECKNDPTAILCDNCFKKFFKWFSILSADEKSKMREDR